MIRIGTRGSDLALWQANHVASLIGKDDSGKDRSEIVIIKTRGDRIQNVSFDKMEGKGFFTKEIEDALLQKHVDVAVHSMKDLPTDEVPGLRIAAVTEREDPTDVMLIREECFVDTKPVPLAKGATIGTSSLRRVGQIKSAMETLDPIALRGNLPTRIKRLREKKYDAIIVAYAGIKRLGIELSDLRVFRLPYSFFLPAPSQGAIAIQIRSDDKETEDIVKELNHADTVLAVNTERAFLKYFGGGCHIPLGALAEIKNGEISLTGVVASTDGKNSVRETVTGTDPERIGEELAKLLKERGADKYI